MATPVEETKTMIAEVADAIDATRSSLDRLYDLRRHLWRSALDAGVSQREAARCARVTPMAVALALKPKEGTA